MCCIILQESVFLVFSSPIFLSQKVYYNEIFSHLLPGLLHFFKITLGSNKSLDSFAGCKWKELGTIKGGVIINIMVADAWFQVVWVKRQECYCLVNLKIPGFSQSWMHHGISWKLTPWSCSVSRDDWAFVLSLIHCKSHCQELRGPFV